VDETPEDGSRVGVNNVTTLEQKTDEAEASIGVRVVKHNAANGRNDIVFVLFL
jgi:hypothetical protein